MTGSSPERIPNVRSVVGSVAQDAVAYATVRSTGGRVAKGSTVYWQGLGVDEQRRLQRPDDWGSTVLTVLGSTVYFAAAPGPGAAKATLHSWDSASGKVTPLKGVVGGFTFDGKTAFRRSTWVATAFDAHTGQLKRRWTGVRFLAGAAEDDDHLLLAADDGPGSRGAIIRCTIGAGTCELATTQAGLRLLGAH